MKRSTIRRCFQRVFTIVFFLLFLAPAAIAASETTEKEYFGDVLLIDAERGAIGIEEEDENTTNPPKKFAFVFDVQGDVVTDPQSRSLEARQIQAGDKVSIYTIKDASGAEKVDQIIDYNRFPED